MKKIALHWQILIALVLAIGAGFLLKPRYQINETVRTNLESQVEAIQKNSQGKPEGPQLQIDDVKKLQSLDGQTFTNEMRFDESVYKALAIEGLDKEAYDKTTFKKMIIEAAKSEPVLYISWMGDIFLRALKMIIVPLILSSIISGITNLGGGESLGRLGGKTLMYYMSTSVLAISTGLIAVNLFQPGIGAPIGDHEMIEGLESARGSFGSTLLNMIPTNVFDALSSGKMLSIIFFSILFGYFITQVGDEYQSLMTKFFNATFDIMMKMTMFIIKFTPYGVFGLVAKTVAEQAGNQAALAAMAGSLGLYMVTVIIALGVHFFVSLPLIVRFVGRANPFAHLRNMTNALLTAFSTSSSSATLPLTMESVEHKSGVSNRVTSFTLPLGATINMDGTALYECVAAMYIAQAYGFQLGLVDQIIVIMTALLASIGAAGIPMAGLVMISVILTAVGLPLEGLGMILAVDRILDMLRTTTNVWSDSCGAVVIARSEGEELNV